jgi:hypothetical protein
LRIDLRTLTPEQIVALGQYTSRWAAIRQSTAPADRSAAEAGVRLAYRAAGLDLPQRIVWCGGPIELIELTALVLRTAAANVSSIVIHDVHTRVAAAVKRRVHSSVRATVANAFTPHDTVSRAVSEAVGRSTRQQRLPIWLRFRRVFSWSGARDQLAGLSGGPIGQPELAWLGIYEYFHDVCQLRAETATLQGLWRVVKNAGWILPHKRVCWLAERPSVLRADARGRLHNAAGPALHFPDGWSYYAWKGIQVPAGLIEQPEQISMQAIDKEPDNRVRHCMIEIMTPERYVANGGAVRVAEDETGVLWRKTWWADAWAAVEVINGTPQPDGARKHYYLQVPSDLQTPRQAVAWTYGLTAGEYARLAIRT